MRKLTQLIKDDMKPALGVTEPGAIAFAVAKAKENTSGQVQSVKVALNSGMYKNAYTCGIPNSPFFGNLYAAALGAVAADASFGLESLRDISDEDNEKAKCMVDEGKIDVVLDHMGSEITIDAEVKTEEDTCIVMIRHAHTNIVKIIKNGEILYNIENTETVADDVKTSDHAESQETAEVIAEIHKFTLAEILDYVSNVPAEEISFIKEAFEMNLELLEEGLASEGATIAQHLYRQNGNQLISDEILKTAQLLCNGAIEARVLGYSKPAMSITGSGAHGIIATMPLYAYAVVAGNKANNASEAEEANKVNNASEAEEANKANSASESENTNNANDAIIMDKLCRATALSYLITMYIKEYSGKLSAFCGCGIAAGTGMACGLAYLQDANLKQMTLVIQNMASGLTGMICDGGNHGCAMKGIVAVDAAFRAVDLAMQEICIENVHGINGMNPEDTMKHMGMIASPGMVKTEETIVEIMQNK